MYKRVPLCGLWNYYWSRGGAAPGEPVFHYTKGLLNDRAYPGKHHCGNLAAYLFRYQRAKESQHQKSPQRDSSSSVLHPEQRLVAIFALGGYILGPGLFLGIMIYAGIGVWLSYVAPIAMVLDAIE